MFSVTGEHDHGPFGGGSAQLIWGLRSDGTLAKVSDVERGKRCNCVCPACERPLIAKKGRKLAEHFAHEGGNACSGVRETNAHAWAKQILDRRKTLWLPADYAVADDWRRKAFEARYFEFDSARLEKREGDIVPDVVLEAKGRILIVEILVTHACDDVKVGKIRDLGTSALEIDLSAYRYAQSEDEVADALIGGPNGGAYREWLFNARTEERSRLLAEEKAKKAAEREVRRKAREQDQIAALAQAARSIRIGKSDRALKDIGVIRDHGIADLAGLHPNCPTGFCVPSKLWQAAIWVRVIIPATIDWGTTVSVRDAICAIDDCIAPEFLREPTLEVMEGVRRALPSFHFPADAAEGYFLELMRRGVLVREGSGDFWVEDELRFRLDQRSGELDARRKRERQGLDRINAILKKIPKEDKVGFSLYRWLARPIPQLGLRFADMVERGSDGWESFQLALGEIERMFWFGQKPCQVTLGLPLDAVISRAIKRQEDAAAVAEQQRIQAEEDARQHRGHWVKREAVKDLGESEALAWLSSPAAEGETYLTRAAGSPEGLSSATKELSAKVAQARLDAMASRYRAQLVAAAFVAFGMDRANLFMRACDPRIGMSPSERCIDAIGLRDCLALLPKRGRRAPG